MKRTILYVVVSFLFSMNLLAQDRFEHFTFDFGGAFSFPAGQLANHARTGFEFTASGGPRFNPSLSVGLDFALSYFNVKNSLQSQAGTDFSRGAIVRTWSLTVNPTYQFLRREKSSYYVTAGYGLYNRQLQIPVPDLSAAASACDAFWKVCVNNSPTSTSVTGNLNPYVGGYNVGGGVNIGTRTKFFVEVRYHHMFTSDSPTELIPLTFGVRW
jgi:hypothetical protein